MQYKLFPLNLTLTTKSNYLNRAVGRAERTPDLTQVFFQIPVHLFIGWKAIWLDLIGIHFLKFFLESSKSTRNLVKIEGMNTKQTTCFLDTAWHDHAESSSYVNIFILQPLQRCICIQNVQSQKQRDLKACHVLNGSQCFADNGKFRLYKVLELMRQGRWQALKLIHTSRNWAPHNQAVILDYVLGKCPTYKCDFVYQI